MQKLLSLTSRRFKRMQKLLFAKVFSLIIVKEYDIIRLKIFPMKGSEKMFVTDSKYISRQYLNGAKTTADICREYGLSISTLSRVIKSDRLVRNEVARRLSLCFGAGAIRHSADTD